MDGTLPCGTLFRWAGSKRKLLPRLTEMVAAHRNLKYFEPFAGSGCLYFALAPTAAVISDINAELINAYEMIRLYPKRIHEIVTSFPRSDKYYYSLRAQDPAELGKKMRAARFTYLNRHCFNGIYRTNKRGQFNVPKGKQTGEVPSLGSFKQAAKLLRNAELKCCDFEEIGEQVDSESLVYLDPPYDYSNRIDRGEYGPGTFRKSDIARLERLVARINSIGAKFVLSYVDVKDIHHFREQWTCQKISVKRQVASFSEHRKVIKELIFTNIE